MQHITRRSLRLANADACRRLCPHTKVKWYLIQGTASLELTCRSIGTQAVHVTLASAIDIPNDPLSWTQRSEGAHRGKQQLSLQSSTVVHGMCATSDPSVVIHNDPLDTIISDIISHEWGDAIAEYRAVMSRVQLPHSLTWVPDGDRRITTHYFLYKGKCIDYLSISLEPTQAYAFIKLDKKSREKCYIGPIRLTSSIISEAVLNEAISQVLEANSFLRGQPKYLSACLNLIDREISPLPLLTYNHTLQHQRIGNISPYIDLPHATIGEVWSRLAYTYSVDYRGSKMTVMIVPNNQDNYSLLIELMILDFHNSQRITRSYIPIGPIVFPLPISEGVLYGVVRDTVLDARDQLYREGARGCHPDYFIPVYYNRSAVRQIINNLLEEWRRLRQSS